MYLHLFVKCPQTPGHELAAGTAVKGKLRQGLHLPTSKEL